MPVMVEPLSSLRRQPQAPDFISLKILPSSSKTVNTTNFIAGYNAELMNS
jgi:hypothetical protein